MVVAAAGMEEQVLVEPVVAQLVLQAVLVFKAVVAAHKVQVERRATHNVTTDPRALHIWEVEVTTKVVVVAAATTAVVAVETTPVVAVARVRSRY